MIVPVILSGGSGTRLWPLSTPQRPKQFIALTGPDSLFRQTLDRVADPAVYGPPMIVANEAHEELCRAELAGTPNWQLVLEPIARNTAAAIVMAAAVARRRHGEEAVILVMPSDHRIGDLHAFHRAVQHGVAAAKAGRLVTFGVRPTSAETGFGYLEAGVPLNDDGAVTTVARFIEKPPREDAEMMVAAGNYFWNGGIFLYSVTAFLAEAERLAPAVHAAALAAIDQGTDDGRVLNPDRAALAESPDISVDYAVMERSERIAMVVLDADWSDVGSWDALAELPGESADPRLVKQLQSRNCYVRSDQLRVSLLGVDDLIVVAAGDRVVIMKRGQSQNIRQLATAAADD